MTTIELLEDRISSLEKQVYGLEQAASTGDTPAENSVIDNLLHANTLISSALSGREKTNAVMKRLPELNGYLDPVLEESDLPLDAKVQLLLAMEPEIKENYRLLTQMQELMPILETDRIRDVPELSAGLSKLSLSYLEIQQELDELTANVHDLFSKYSSVMTSITKSMITMDNAVLKAEIAAMPKKQIE